MNNAKVTVTKEVADALTICIYNGISVRTMLRNNVHGDLYGVYAPLQMMHVEDLAQALIVGYEVERTAEEKVREYFVSYGHSPSAMERKLGVIDTLNLLGIKISEVNA